MAYEKKEGDFTLFSNNRKGSNPKAPDRTGTILIDGEEWEMAGWLKKDKNGNTYLAGNAKPKGEGRRRPRETDNDPDW